MPNIELTTATDQQKREILDILGATRWNASGVSLANSLNIDTTGGSSVTAAVQTAVDAAAAAGGGVVQLPAGTLLFTASVVMKDKVTIRGAGMDATFVKQAGSHYLFSRPTGGPLLSFCSVADLTMVGLHDVTPTLGGDSDRHIAISSVQHLVIERVKSVYCRQMAITATYSDHVVVRDCHVEKCARDAINITTVNRVQVENNFIRGCSDDAIAIHTNWVSGSKPTEGHSVIGNVIEDSYGIKMLGGVNAVIVGNTGRLLKGYGIFFADESPEGVNDSYALTITGNKFTDVFNAQLFGAGFIQTGIRVASSATSFANPVTVSGSTITRALPEVLSPVSNTLTAQNAGGHTIIISGNIVSMYTLDNGASYESLGYGRTYASNGGYVNITPFNHKRGGECIRIGGAILDMSITGNVLKNCSSGIAVEADLTYLGDLTVASNQILRYQNFGVSLETPAAKRGRVLVNGNVFDGDPYLEHSNRNLVSGNPDGTWTNAAVHPAGVNMVNWGHIVVTDNTFRNLNKSVHASNSQATFGPNTFYMQPTTSFGIWNQEVNANKGIRAVLGFNDKSTVVVEDSDPSDGSYNSYSGSCDMTTMSNAIPTSGYFVAGAFVRNVGTVGTGTTTLGWYRLTTGTGHVAGTDWRTLNVTGA